MASGPKPQWVNFSDLSFAVADALYIGVCVDVLLVCVCVLEKIKICLKKKVIKISLFLFIYIIFFFLFAWQTRHVPFITVIQDKTSRTIAQLTSA